MEQQYIEPVKKNSPRQTKKNIETRKFKSKTIFILVILFCGVFAGITITMLVLHGNNSKDGKSEVGSVTRELGKLIILPTDEEPTLATITDKEKLAPGSFLANGNNGDKVLIYEKAKRVIIYRPSEKKIVDVGPVNIAEPDGEPVSNKVK